MAGDRQSPILGRLGRSPLDFAQVAITRVTTRDDRLPILLQKVDVSTKRGEEPSQLDVGLVMNLETNETLIEPIGVLVASK